MFGGLTALCFFSVPLPKPALWEGPTVQATYAYLHCGQKSGHRKVAEDLFLIIFGLELLQATFLCPLLGSRAGGKLPGSRAGGELPDLA